MFATFSAVPLDSVDRQHKNAFTPDGFSMVIFPSYTWSVGSGVELVAGAFWMIGKRHTKFSF